MDSVDNFVGNGAGLSPTHFNLATLQQKSLIIIKIKKEERSLNEHR